MKTYTVTIPTIGCVVYEVEAKDEAEAKKKIHEGKGTVTEENTGDWQPDSEWEFEEE
jgi:hypothetical protein